MTQKRNDSEFQRTAIGMRRDGRRSCAAYSPVPRISMASPSTLNIHVARPGSCAICGHAHLVHVGDKDFGVSGCDHFEGRIFDYGVPIPYYECL